MNFLGHIYLSGDNELLMVGNFIADYVKGKKYLEYPDGIRDGILLHRAIDTFTDRNDHFIRIKNHLKSVYGLYSGVVADLFIDHFLAANWNSFHPTGLEPYSKRVYAIFTANYDWLPLRIQGFFNNLVGRNRLLSYSTVGGVEEALMIMAFRTSLPGKTKEAISILRNNYEELRGLSIQFLEEVIQYTKEMQTTMGIHSTTNTEIRATPLVNTATKGKT